MLIKLSKRIRKIIFLLSFFIKKLIKIFFLKNIKIINNIIIILNKLFIAGPNIKKKGYNIANN